MTSSTHHDPMSYDDDDDELIKTRIQNNRTSLRKVKVFAKMKTLFYYKLESLID